MVTFSDTVLGAIFFIAGILCLVCGVLITPFYIWYIKQRHRQVWEYDLQYLGYTPWFNMYRLWFFLFNNVFKKTQDKWFIRLSFLFKYMYLPSLFLMVILFFVVPIFLLGYQ